MKLILEYDGEKEIKDIKSIDILKDELLEFAGYFIPDDDVDAPELLEKGFFDDLINDIEEYYVKSFFLVAKSFFTAIKTIYSTNDIEVIKSELVTINKAFDDAGCSIKYILE